MPISTETCAREVLDVVPLVMRAVRAEMRRNRAADLTVPQFRTLKFVDRQAGASLSEVAEHVGIALPSMSALVEGLVERRLILREPAPTDRRRITLNLTERGQSLLAETYTVTQARLAEKLMGLSGADQTVVVQALESLRLIFSSPEPLDGAKR